MSIEERLEIFHESNPRVYSLFDRFAREVISRGYRRFSADAILHRERAGLHGNFKGWVQARKVLEREMGFT